MNPAWLAGSADRERTVGVLRAGFTEGRLTQDELDDRVGAGLRGPHLRGPLGADRRPARRASALPAGPALPAGEPQSCRAAPSEVSTWHSAAALIITALVIFTLAALVTAIATAHAQPMPFQQFQHVPPGAVVPPAAQQPAVLAPCHHGAGR